MIRASILPGEYTQLKALVAEAETGLADGDFADIETAVLNKAAALGLSFVSQLTTAELTLIISLVKTGQPAPAAEPAVSAT